MTKLLKDYDDLMEASGHYRQSWKQVGEHYYRFNGRANKRGRIYLFVGKRGWTSEEEAKKKWKRVGEILYDRAKGGWYYKSHGFRHGYWKDWWEAAYAKHMSTLRSASIPPTIPKHMIKDVDPGDFSLDDLDMKMF